MIEFYLLNTANSIKAQFPIRMQPGIKEEQRRGQEFVFGQLERVRTV